MRTLPLVKAYVTENADRIRYIRLPTDYHGIGDAIKRSKETGHHLASLELAAQKDYTFLIGFKYRGGVQEVLITYWWKAKGHQRETFLQFPGMNQSFFSGFCGAIRKEFIGYLMQSSAR